MAVPALIPTPEDTAMPQAAEQQQPPQPKLRYSQRHRQKVNDMREEQRTESRLVHQGKLDRVQRWLDDCQRAREEPREASRTSREPSSSSAEEGCQSQDHQRQQQQRVEDQDDESGYDDIDGDTEDLLLSVLVARPEYHTVPTAGQVRQFARELRVYNAKLWTLGRTRGYFRGQSQSQSQSIAQRSTSWGSEKSTAPQSLPEYPSDIDDEPDLELGDGEEDSNTVKLGSSNGNDNNNNDDENNDDDEMMIIDQTPPSLYLATSRELSPAEEELHMEMLHEYQQRRRSLTASKEVEGMAVAMDVDGGAAPECPNFVPVEAC